VNLPAEDEKPPMLGSTKSKATSIWSTSFVNLPAEDEKPPMLGSTKQGTSIWSTSFAWTSGRHLVDIDALDGEHDAPNMPPPPPPPPPRSWTVVGAAATLLGIGMKPRGGAKAAAAANGEVASDGPTARKPSRKAADLPADKAARQSVFNFAAKADQFHSKSWVDPYETKLAAIAATSSQTRISEVEDDTIEEEQYAEPGGEYMFSYEELCKTASFLPKGVDPGHRELYMHDSDFEKVLGWSRAEFADLKDWKKEQLKRKAKLF